MEVQEICRVKVIVNGQVQGVGFRAFTRTRATQLGLTGWVRNMVDGRVEAEVEGARTAVEHFIQGVQQGPMLSSVTNIEVTWLEAHGQDSAFHIVY